MISKEDLKAVRRQFTDDGEKLGGPPAPEELLAYSRGELSEEDEARVRERLVYYPDLARSLAEPFPSEGAQPGDPDFVSDDEFARHWDSMQKRMRKPAESARVLQFWRVSAAMAAALAIVFGTLLWRATTRLAAPRVVWEQQVLLPDGARGPRAEAATLTAEGESVLLIIPLIGQRDFETYRLEIVSVASGRAIWSSASLRPREDDAFAIVVPRHSLKPGTYQVVVHGVAGTSEERLAGYSVRVPAR